MAIIHATDDEFETAVLNADGPVLWISGRNGVGRAAGAPALDELSDEYASKLTIVKINIDENPVAPTDHNVRSIPTMMIFQDGVVSATKIGAAPKGQIKDWIDETLWSRLARKACPAR